MATKSPSKITNKASSRPTSKSVIKQPFKSSSTSIDSSKFAHGYGSLSPEQMRRRKIIKRGFRLNIMLCGTVGSGKSTFLNNLCNKTVFPTAGKSLKAEDLDKDPGTQIQMANIDFEEDGTTIKLNIVEAPGFGENVDNSECCTTLINYIEEQFDDILREESRVRRNPKFVDNRVHVVIYFITVTGHGLREFDVEIMSALSQRANVIPVISKSDTLTAEELQLNKHLIMEDIREYRIPIYFFPHNTEDEETIGENNLLRELTPFAIVSSNMEHKLDGEIIKARQYPWGVARINDSSYSDFAQLRNMLFGSHMQDLKEITHEFFYEKYRTKKLSSSGEIESVDDATPSPSGFHSATNSQQAEQERMKDIESTFHHEIEAKKRELLLQEAQLKELTERLRERKGHD